MKLFGRNLGVFLIVFALAGMERCGIFALPAMATENVWRIDDTTTYAWNEDAGEADCLDLPCRYPCCEDETETPPAPDFGGCWRSRSTLTGNWGCLRPHWAEKGITFDADVTQFYYGVTSGGLERVFQYSGHGDYVMNVDAGKLGVQEGLFIKLRAEHRFGEPLATASGAFLPPMLLADLPTLRSENLILTNVLFTQMLSESFGVFAGKLDTLDGDANAFAHGRGKTQFSNTAFVVNPMMMRTIPYSTLAAGFTILHERQPIFTFTVLNPTDTTTTSGFNELFAEGVAMAAELRLPTQFFGLPGHQLFGGTWNSQEFVRLGQDPRVIYPDVPIATRDGSWSLYYNFDQYLVVNPANPAQGWGLFGRAGLADEETNPAAYFLSAGIGGNSILRGREADTFGVGWYYIATSRQIGPFIEAAVGPVGDGQGIEMFYNVAVTPWCHVTPDFQIVRPAREEVDTAIIAGVRMNVIF